MTRAEKSAQGENLKWAFRHTDEEGRTQQFVVGLDPGAVAGE